MRCPFCGNQGSFIVQGSSWVSLGEVRHTRRCTVCRRSFRTVEHVVAFRDDAPSGWLFVTPEGLACRVDDPEVADWIGEVLRDQENPRP